MKIEHVCINAIDIERMKDFYCRLFSFVPNEKYHNDKTGWENYFLSTDSGARLELLSKKGMPLQKKERDSSGFVHIAISLGSKEEVDKTIKKAEEEGCEILSLGRVTGDGYYEASFLDIEGNMVEITI
ncbi:MAG: VOC family protein [Bacilli bacterium]|jgi:lactoylglutathione lyase|nr:VOC family protein [Bacilli bacterium]MCH4211093.1 VOC family protein [Bacilli bacterium]MCH4228624.1 VOC family protein [Bacilli bacterium]MCH4277502.1 VOC family protein [Bacilli bacterium]MCI2054868.1 VOC family protein [Bacilli bacterium]